MRHLATIQKLSQIDSIENADNIQVSMMEDLGWECVINKKDGFKVGDLVVYFECDSILPELEEFEFLRAVKFRIKIRKFRKQVSMGLIMPISIIPNGTKIEKGLDVTELLNVKKYDKQAVEEQGLVVSKHRSSVLKFLMRNKAFRTVYIKINSKESGAWPSWIQKTDEERIQTCANILMNNYDKTWVVTEKLDGQSGTFFTYNRKVWGFNKLDFGVCSRNIWLKTPNNSNYWNVAKKYDLEKKMKELVKPTVIQGEILSTNVQGNKYKVTEPDLYVFNIVQDGKRLPYDVMVGLCKVLGLKVMQLVYGKFSAVERWPNLAGNTNEVVKNMVELSIAKSQIADLDREGIVCRLLDDQHVSFKIINPMFLLKYE